MAPAMATKRLRKELIKFQKEPPPGVIAEPDEANILKWYYVIRGPKESPYEGGVYVGKLVFPSEYPMKAPSIHMLTPSGRFQINTKICMSMSDFHPESWNPLWSVATIIKGVQSFMTTEEGTTGGMKASELDRKKFARLSVAYNRKTFPKLFQGDIDAVFEAADHARQKAEEETIKSGNSHADNDNNKLSRRERRLAKDNKSVPRQEEKSKKQHQQDIAVNKDVDKDDDNRSTKDPEEVEKRRKRNAKKRAKQKSKKAAVAAAVVVVAQEEEESND